MFFKKKNRKQNRKEKKQAAKKQMLKEEEVKSELSAYNSRQLMAELARRGYGGKLTFVQEIDITKL